MSNISAYQALEVSAKVLTVDVNATAQALSVSKAQARTIIAARKGGAVATIAAASGKGYKAATLANAQIELASFVSHTGDIDYKKACASVAAILSNGATVNFMVDVTNDGAHGVIVSANRKEWMRLLSEAETMAAQRNKAGKPAPAAKYGAQAVLLHGTIQKHADTLRAAHAVNRQDLLK